MKRVALVFLILLFPAATAHAVKVADITRIGGQRTNVLTGLGLVFGLKGSGDGGAAQATIRPLAKVLSNFSDPATAAELGNASNVALVMLTATVPANGVRDGDKLDVYVTSLGSSPSLR